MRRTVILFALGLFVNTFPTFYLSAIRIPGVLQRIALCYLFASLIVLKADLRGRILWLIGLLASYWLMMRFIPVPGIGAGVLEPGENFAAWVDSLFLNGHMWSYYDGAWDPEGIVSTIPAIATTLFGVLTGQWLRTSFSERRKVAGMVCAGLVLLVAGYILDRWLPINKSIWTSTFSIFMAGLALLCLSFFHLLIDIAGFSRWAKPFIVLGLNPIAIYVLSIILDTTLRSMNLTVSKRTKHILPILHVLNFLHPVFRLGNGIFAVCSCDSSGHVSSRMDYVAKSAFYKGLADIFDAGNK